ncbi:uncharacterized protein KY384_007998 [Bacidia gigantensis]|uniref:uncharacterized protein n=1 Tax=Bacidia gigantensis TaxID=2732470 RepID=UPI001D04D7B9|nr:uncharacterized protein KY384_007998 [Bacidia gigantensis]KAG8527254.1 hypothetical protein KY384_007998 [Bacidia gigantensis]
MNTQMISNWSRLLCGQAKREAPSVLPPSVTKSTPVNDDDEEGQSAGLSSGAQKTPKQKKIIKADSQWFGILVMNDLRLAPDIEIYLEGTNPRGSAEDFFRGSFQFSFGHKENDNPFANLDLQTQSQAMVRLFLVEGRLKFVDTFTRVRRLFVWLYFHDFVTTTWGKNARINKVKVESLITALGLDVTDSNIRYYMTFWQNMNQRGKHLEALVRVFGPGSLFWLQNELTEDL